MKKIICIIINSVLCIILTINIAFFMKEKNNYKRNLENFNNMNYKKSACNVDYEYLLNMFNDEFKVRKYVLNRENSSFNILLEDTKSMEIIDKLFLRIASDKCFNQLENLTIRYNKEKNKYDYYITYNMK